MIICEISVCRASYQACIILQWEKLVTGVCLCSEWAGMDSHGQDKSYFLLYFMILMYLKKSRSSCVPSSLHFIDVRLIFLRHWVILAIRRQVSAPERWPCFPPSWFCAATTCFTCSFFIFNFCILFPPQLVLCAHDMFYGWPYMNSPSCHIPSSFQVLYHHHGHCHHHHHHDFCVKIFTTIKFTNTNIRCQSWAVSTPLQMVWHEKNSSIPK